MKTLFNRIQNHTLLIMITCIAYIPFMGMRVIRTTGDEKVYIAQALEMNSLGHWFVQSLNGQPDYYKGPLHYLLLIFGFKVFGYSLWTAIYMNLLFCLLGAVALAEIIRRTFPEKKSWPLWGGAFFAFNVGVFGHFFASQMEVELAGIFSLAYFFLWRGKSVRDDFAFWVLAGLTGWIKSPLHSVLLGVSAPLFWICTGEFVSRLKKPQTYLAAITGIMICCLGYAPAFFLDRENFIRTYYERETLKPPNGGPWWQALVPMVSYYLIPWMTIALISFVEAFSKISFYFKSWKNIPALENRTFLLGLTTFLPTILFFTVHPYRGENYAVPVTGSVVLMIAFFLQNSSERMIRIRNWILGISVVPLICIPIAVQVFSSRFQLPADIWPNWVTPMIWILSLLAVGLQLKEHFSKQSDGLGVQATLGNVSILMVMGILLGVLGEVEVYQLKGRIQEDREKGKLGQVYYWNLNRLIWNEWGLMSLAVHEKILPLLTEQEMAGAIQRGDLILARDTDRGKEMEEYAKTHFPELRPIVYRWDRWKTHAQDGAGNSMLGRAWKERDLSLIWDRALIMRFVK